MGDYSRDSFKLTNTLHQLQTGETVVDPRHYVGVRMQQGVPLLDSDWNELEDIRRYDVQLSLRHFYGDGIPLGNNGFQIGPVTTDNNFKIENGIALVAGMLVVNASPALTYGDQAVSLAFSLPSLSAPLTGIRTDLVYLDVWEEQVTTSSASRGDERLTNLAIGVETCTRIERRWVVRVAEGVDDLADVTQDAGHVYMALALLRRIEGENRIPVHRITDLRRTGRTVVYLAVQQMTQICITSALQAKTNNLTNADALEVLSTLFTAQEAFLDELDARGDAGSAKTSFVTQYRLLLTGGPGVGGIQTPLTENDLIGAYQGQQQVNAFLSAAVDVLPEGGVSLQYLSVLPFEPLIAAKPYAFTVEFTSGVTSDQTNEIFDVTVELSSALWNVDRETDQITLDNLGGKGTLAFTVTPNAANIECVFTVQAIVRRNPAIVSSQPGLTLALAQRPAVGAKLLYAGPVFNADGRLEISNAELTSGLGMAINFALNNRTIDSHTYRLRWHLSLTVGTEAGWSPLAALPQENQFTVPASSSASAPVTMSGPTGANVVGNRGTLQVTLFRMDGVDLPAETQETISVNFIVV